MAQEYVNKNKSNDNDGHYEMSHMIRDPRANVAVSGVPSDKKSLKGEKQGYKNNNSKHIEPPANPKKE